MCRKFYTAILFPLFVLPSFSWGGIIPGTEVDGFLADQTQLQVARLALEGLQPIIEQSQVLTGERKIRIFNILATFAERGLERKNTRCSRGRDELPLHLDFDRDEDAIYLCKDFFEDHLVVTEAEMDQAVWMLQKAILHEISHLLTYQNRAGERAYYRTFDNTSERFALRILCEFAPEPEFKHCFSSPAAYAALHISTEFPQTSVSIKGFQPSADSTFETIERELSVLRRNTQVGMITALLGGVKASRHEESPHATVRALRKIFSDFKSVARKATYTLVVDEVLVNFADVARGQFQCRLGVKVSVYNNRVSEISDRAFGEVGVLSADDCASGSIPQSSFRDALKEAVSRLHKIRTAERNFRVNFDPREPLITTGAADATELSDEVNNLVRETLWKYIGDDWAPSHRSTIWDFSSRVAIRGEADPGFLDVVVDTIDLAVKDGFLSIGMFLNVSKDHSAADPMEFHHKIPFEVSSGREDPLALSQKVVDEVLELLDSSVEQVAVRSAQKVCDYVVDVVSGSRFSAVKVDYLSDENLSKYLTRLRSPRTELERLTLHFCAEELETKIEVRKSEQFLSH